MKEILKNKLSTINKDAFVGNRARVFKLDFEAPKSVGSKKDIANTEPKRAKRRPCSGCSRKRKRG